MSKEEPVEEFYKTLKVGDIVKIKYASEVGCTDCVFEITGLYGDGDYGFDFKLVNSCTTSSCKRSGTIGNWRLDEGNVIVFPA